MPPAALEQAGGVGAGGGPLQAQAHPGAPAGQGPWRSALGTRREGLAVASPRPPWSAGAPEEGDKSEEQRLNLSGS